MPKPAVGRIVHVLVDPKVNNGSDVAPAIITRVWSDNCVNLRVMHDGPAVQDPSDRQFRQDWLTSHPLHESREALEAHHAAKREEHGDDYARYPFGAFWPPHV